MLSPYTHVKHHLQRAQAILKTSDEREAQLKLVIERTIELVDELEHTKRRTSNVVYLSHLRPSGS